MMILFSLDFLVFYRLFNDSSVDRSSLDGLKADNDGNTWRMHSPLKYNVDNNCDVRVKRNSVCVCQFVCKYICMCRFSRIVAPNYMRENG